MKHFLVLLLIVISNNNSNAQDCKSIGKNLVSKIKKTNYKDLLPYYDSKEKKWGLMNKNGNALTEPFDESPFTFNANIHNTYFITNYKGCDIDINYIDMEFNVKKHEEEYDEYAIAEYNEHNASDHDTLKGFTVEKHQSLIVKTGEVKNKMEISKFSNRFKEVESLFNYNDKWYALATLKNSSQMGIIDQNGETLPNFDFNYTKLYQLDYYNGIKDNEIWYYYEDLSNKMGFINIVGETIMKGELLSECIFYNDYYCVQKKDEESGVINLRTLKWAIKPQKNIKLQNIIELGDYGNDNCSYYVLAIEGKEQYLVDLNMKKYKRIHTKRKL